jgi:UvrD-like helicase C-terminal domain
MAVAADVLAFAAPGEEPPESVRAEGVPPRALQVADLAVVAEVVRAELVDIADGKLAVIAPASRLGEIAAALPSAITGDHPESLDAQVALLTVTQAKGLEFDRVVLADPAGILDASANGGRDLYVAITRATHRLTVVHEGDLPAPLQRLDRLTGHPF